MNTVLLGNIVALIGAAIMVLIGFLKTKKQILTAQCFQYVALSVSNAILGAFTGITANVVGIARNLFCMKKEFTVPWKIAFIAVQLALLLAFNSDGWLAGREIVVARQTRNAKEWDGLLVPKAVVANRFFPDLVEKARVAAEKAEAAEAAYDCFIAEETDKGQDSDILEQNGDEWKVVSDKELKKLSSQSDTAKNCLALKKAKTDAAAAEKSASKALDEATEKKYPLLTEEEIRSMLFDDKWFAALRTSVLSIFDASLRKFATALATLAERYAHSLGELEANLAASQDEVHAVLREMGFNW